MPGRRAEGAAEAAKPLADTVRALERDTRELFSAIEQLSASASAALREQIDRRPYASLAAGFAAGYVLGGGLTVRLATGIAAATGRATLARMVARGLGRALTSGGGLHD